MKKIPCRNCIVFAICNSKVQKLNGVYKTQFIMNKLTSCSLFSDWAYKVHNTYNYQYTEQQMKHFTSFFKIKYDVMPDSHLAPTTYVGDWNEKPNT